MARQTRHSPWCPAMISKRHTYNGRLTITVDWEDTSEGPSTAGIPASRVKLLQADAPRPPTPPAHPTWIHSPREGQHHSNSSTGTPTTVTQAPTHGPQPQSRSRSATKNTSQWAPLTWPSLQRQLGPLAPPREPPCIPTGAPVLTVNECWASLILSGAKTMEIRTRNTLKRGTIYVATSGLGEVWGQVGILDSTQLTRDEWRSHASAHRIGTRTNPSILPPFPSPPPYAWRLSNATRYSSPVPMDRPRGPVTWVTFVPAAMSTPPAEEAPTVSRVTTPSAAPDSDQLTSDTADVDPLTNPRRESARRVHTETHSRPGPDHIGDRAALTMEVLLRHQDHVRAAMELSNHPPTWSMVRAHSSRDSTGIKRAKLRIPSNKMMLLQPCTGTRKMPSEGRNAHPRARVTTRGRKPGNACLRPSTPAWKMREEVLLHMGSISLGKGGNTARTSMLIYRPNWDG